MRPPPCRHIRARAVASALAALLACVLHAGAARALVISEVMFNPVGGVFGNDDGLEFVELFNDTAAPVDLADYSLGWGGGDYTFGTLDLDVLGILAPGAYVVFGDAASPLDFDPDLPDGLFTAAGVGLFAGDASTIPGATPVDAVIYAHIIGFNFDDLIDETGAIGAIDATTTASGQSIERRNDGSWAATGSPTPGTGTLVPEPGTALLTSLGLALLAVRRRV